MAGFATLAAVAIGVAAMAVVQRNRADDAATVAEVAAAEAESQRSVAEQATNEAEVLRTTAERRALIDSARAAGLTAAELADEDPEAAVLVGLEAEALAEEAGVVLPEVVSGLWEAANAERGRRRLIRTRFDVGPQEFGLFGQGVSPSPDGRLGVATLAEQRIAKEVLLGPEVVSKWASTTTISDLSSGETVSTLAGGEGLPLYSTWDPVSSEVVTANGDGSVTWWDPVRGEPLRREQLTDGPLWHVTLDGNRLATSENVDQTDGRSIAVLRDRASLQPIVAVPDSLWSTLSPNGKWWATASIRGEIIVHDARDGAEVLRTQPTDWPEAALRSADWAGEDDAMWLVRNGALIRVELNSGGLQSVGPPELYANGGCCASAASRQRGTSPLVVAGVPPRVRTSPNGDLVAYGASDARVYIRSAATDQRVIVLEGHASAVDSVEWLPDGSGLVSVDRSGIALVWNVVPPSGSPLPLVRAAENPETHAQFGDRAVLLADRSGGGVLVEPASGRTIVEFGLTGERHDLDVVASEAAGIFVAPSDGGVRVYDVDERRWIGEFGVDGIQRPLALSADGTRLLAGTAASSSADDAPATVMIDTTTGAVLWRLDRFSTDSALIIGDVVVLAGFRGEGFTNRLVVLDGVTGERRFESTRSWTTPAMAASPDGRRVATLRDDGTITIYDLDQFVESPTGQAVVVSASMDDTFGAQLVYSSDGSILFGAGIDGTVHAWSAETLDELWSIDAGTAAPGLRVSDDLLWFGVPVDAGPRSDAGFGLAAIPFDQHSIAEWAAATVTRELTDDECQQYLERACAVRVDR